VVFEIFRSPVTQKQLAISKRAQQVHYYCILRDPQIWFCTCWNHFWKSFKINSLKTIDTEKLHWDVTLTKYPYKYSHNRRDFFNFFLSYQSVNQWESLTGVARGISPHSEIGHLLKTADRHKTIQFVSHWSKRHESIPLKVTTEAYGGQPKPISSNQTAFLRSSNARISLKYWSAFYFVGHLSPQLPLILNI